jgi:hypothetical protein
MKCYFIQQAERKTLPFWLALVFLLLLGTNANAQTTITATQDAYTDNQITNNQSNGGSAYTTSYMSSVTDNGSVVNIVGDQTSSYATSNCKAALKFALPTSSAGVISSVKLRLKIVGVSGVPTATITATDDTSWAQTDNAPTSTFASLVNPATVVSNVSVNAGDAGIWKEIDITNYIKSKVGTSAVAVTLIITGNGSSDNYFDFVADDNHTPGNTAQLAITYSTPTVTTQAVSGITKTTATGNGNVTDLGTSNPTAHGVCWNTSGSPTTSGSKVNNGAKSATGSFTASMTGLTGNTKYYVRAYATNDSGTVYGGEVTFTTSPVAPGAPTIGSATAGDTSASVSFIAPASNGGATITSYTVTSSPGGKTVSGASSPITVTGLTNRTAYTFKVTATNSAGTSDSSAASNSIMLKESQTITFIAPYVQDLGSSLTLTATASSGLTPTFSTSTPSVCSLTSGGKLTFLQTGMCIINADQAGDSAYLAAPTVTVSIQVIPVIPDAPTIGTATAGDAQASVTFLAPSYNGGASISGYTITSSPGGKTGSGSTSPITVTGLTNGIAYTFKVTATNSAGTSNSSWASNSVMPKGSQTIEFSAPVAQNFGTSPTLTATASSGLTPAFSTSTPSVCSITPGGKLTFLKAGTCIINADQAGDSAYLAAPTVNVNIQVIAVIPGAPTIGTATAGNASASVAFTPPVFTGGTPITNYTVLAVPDGITATGSNSPITVTGLTNGTSYRFIVTATNSVGQSDTSSFSNVATPFAAASATTKSATSITTTGATLNGIVNANGGSSIAKFAYGLTTSCGDTVMASQSPVTGTSNTSVSKALTGLTSGTTYHFKVIGTNNAGTIAGADSTFATLPSAPVATVATDISLNSFTAHWDAVTGATGYRLDVLTDSAFVTGYNNLDVNNVLTCTVTGLTANTTYYYRVRAYKASIGSANSNLITTTTLDYPTVVYSDTISTELLYKEPNIPGNALDYAADWSPSTENHYYAAQSVEVITPGVYTLEITNADFRDSLGNMSNDAVLFLYNSFDPSEPLLNGIVANDDAPYDPNDASLSSIKNYTLTAGKYILVATPFDTAFYGAVDYKISGPALVNIIKAPKKPVILSASSVNAINFVASWDSAGTNAKSFYLEAATDSLFVNHITGYDSLRVNNATTYPVTGLSANTPYYYRVKSYNAGLRSGYSNTMTVVTSPATSSVTVVTITPVSLTLTWTPVITAVKYFLDVATDNTFESVRPKTSDNNASINKISADAENGSGSSNSCSSIVYSGIPVGDVTSYTIPNLNAGTTYYYRVRAANQAGTIVNTSAPQSATTTSQSTTIGSYTISSPSAKANWEAGTYKYIEWKKTGGVAYGSIQIEYTTDGGTSWNKVNKTPIAGLTCYSWLVPSVNSTNCKVRISNYVTKKVFDETDSPFTIYTGNIAAKNYPNPFNPSTKIQFSIEKSGFVTLKIYNSIGQQVAQIVNGEIEAGLHEYEFNASSLTSGVYFYNLKYGNHSETHKMLLMK